MSNSIQTLLILAIVFAGFSAKALQCNELSNVSEPIDSRSLSSRVKADNLRSIIERVLSGAVSPKEIKATPKNEFLTFSARSSSRGWDRFKGRIREVRKNAIGQIELVFLSLIRHRNNPRIVEEVEEVILLSLLDLRTILVTKILSRGEESDVASLVRQALAESKLIQFETADGRSHNVGRVQDIYEGHFTLSTSIWDTDQTIRDIDPYSIKVFYPPTRQVDPSHVALLNDLKDAKNRRTYVSFKYATSYGERKFEGWISAIETIENGEANLILDDQFLGTKRSDLRVLLSAVIPSSLMFGPRISTEPRPAKVFDPGVATQISVYVSDINGTNTRSVQVTHEVLDQLPVFSDNELVSGLRLPEELNQLLTQGKEVQIYFSSLGIRIRLTIRHIEVGGILFGSTESDVNFAYAEPPQERPLLSSVYLPDRSRFYDNEWVELMTGVGYPEAPAHVLRIRMGSIRSRFIFKYLETKEPDLFAKMRGAFPENYMDATLAETALFLNGMKFSLSRGIVEISPHSALPAYAKFASAVKFVLDNNKVFYSSNAKASGIELGIYDRGTYPMPFEMGKKKFDFASSLFEAMDKLGLRFDEAKMNWVKK